MQKQRDDVTQVLQSIARLENELRQLRQEVISLVRTQPELVKGTRKHGSKAASLYGILPPANVPLEEFRKLRRSGTPRSLRG